MITLLLGAVVILPAWVSSAASSAVHVPNITRDLKVAYYINLDRQPSRRAHMESQLREAGLPARRWSATSRLRVEAGEFDNDYVKRQGVHPALFDTRLHTTEQESNGTIGCFLSHTLALLEASKELGPNDLLLIMEDDLVIPVDWRIRMQAALDQAPKDWQLLKISGWGSARPKDLVSKHTPSRYEEMVHMFRTFAHPWEPQVPPHMSIYRMRGPFKEPSTWSWLTGSPYFYYAGTGAYFVRGSSIQKVIHHLRSQPINDLDAMLLSKSMQFYEAWPHVFDLAYDAFNGVGLHGKKAMDEGDAHDSLEAHSSQRTSDELAPADRDKSSMKIGVSPRSMTVLESGQNNTPVELNSMVRRASIRMHNQSSKRVVEKTREIIEQSSIAQDPKQAQYGHPLWLKRCASIYLDVGSNIGVQVRKFYEPERYPDAPILDLFNKRFGAPEERSLSAEQTGLCVLGLEPNPQHKAHLRRLEEKYSARGWHVHFYPFAAWKEEGYMLFNEDANSSSGDYGAMLAPSVHNSNASMVPVRTVNLAEFIKTLPPHSVKLLKVDIEGAEYQTVMRMVQDGVLCEGTVDAASIELHTKGDLANWQDDQSRDALSRQISKTRCGLGGATTQLVDASDEMYATDDPEKDIAGREVEEHRLAHDRFVKRCYIVLVLMIILAIGGAGFHYRGKSALKKADELRGHRVERYSFIAAQSMTSVRC